MLRGESIKGGNHRQIFPMCYQRLFSLNCYFEYQYFLGITFVSCKSLQYIKGIYLILQLR